MEIGDIIVQHKSRIINIIILLVALLIAKNIYKSQTRIIDSLRQKKELEIKKNTVLDDISRMERKIDFLKTQFTKKEVSSVIDTVGNIAKEAKIKIVSVRPQPERDYPVYLKYPIDLVIQVKDYHSLGRFMGTIESIPDIYIMVERINIIPIPGASKTQEGEKITVELTLSTIFFKG